MNLHVKTTSTIHCYLDSYEKNAFQVVIKVLKTLNEKDVTVSGDNYSLSSFEFDLITEKLSKIIKGRITKDEAIEDNAFSCPTYETRPNVRISFDEYEEEEEENEEYEED